MNNQSVSLVATANTKQDWQKIWQPNVGEAANKQESPSPPTNQEIVCIEQIVARPYYVPCKLQCTILHCCGHVLTMTTPTNITSGCSYRGLKKWLQYGIAR